MPKIGLTASNDIELKDKETKGLFNAVQIKLTGEILTNPDFESEEQTAKVLIQKAIQSDLIDYFFRKVPVEMSKNVIKSTFKVMGLIYFGNMSDVISEIERLSVEKAKEYLINYLQQNEIKTAKGNLNKYSYMSYLGTLENPNFQYIIVYKPLENDYAMVSMEFYSSKTISPPILTASTRCNLNEDLIPFILRITGKVEKNWDTYTWIEGPDIKVVFDEPVPEIEIAEEPGFWDKLKNGINNVWQEIKTFFRKLNPFTATVAPLLGPERAELDQEEPIEEKDEVVQVEEIWQETGQDIGQEIGQESESKQKPLTLEEIQAKLDEVSEKISALIQEINEFVKDLKPSDISSEQDKPEEEKQEKEEEEEKKEEEKNDWVADADPISMPADEPTPFCVKIEGQEPDKDKIIINEVAWMGTNESSNNEWIELKNITDEPVDISGWQLLDTGIQIGIMFPNLEVIPGNSFYLLERTDDDSVPNVSANLIYTGVLNNNNEGLDLFNKKCELQDEVTADSDWPAGNNQEKKSMERSNNLSWHTYSGEGENGIMGTPKAENSQLVEGEEEEEEEQEEQQQPEQEEETDITCPEISFILEPSQESLSFTINFEIRDDILSTTTPSGLAGFIFRWKEEVGDWQEDEYQEIGGKPLIYSGEREFFGENQKTYYFQIKAKDISNNESDWQEALTTISVLNTVVISEIQIADNEFIELYNSNSQNVEISTWYLSYFSSDRDWNNPWRNKKFPEESSIPANGYYLIGLKGYPISGGNPDADWQPYTSSQLSNDSGAVAVFSWDPKTKTPEEAENERIDALGWGGANVNEDGALSFDSVSDKSLTRKWIAGNQQYQDTDNNQNDFEIRNFSPTNSLGRTILHPPGWSEITP